VKPSSVARIGTSVAVSVILFRSKVVTGTLFVLGQYCMVGVNLAEICAPVWVAYRQLPSIQSEFVTDTSLFIIIKNLLHFLRTTPSSRHSCLKDISAFGFWMIWVLSQSQEPCFSRDTLQYQSFDCTSVATTPPLEQFWPLLQRLIRKYGGTAAVQRLAIKSVPQMRWAFILSTGCTDRLLRLLSQITQFFPPQITCSVTVHTGNAMLETTPSNSDFFSFPRYDSGPILPGTAPLVPWVPLFELETYRGPDDPGINR